MLIYSSRISQVQGSNEPTLVTLQWDKALIKIPAKYSDFADIFLIDLAIELPKNTGINEHIIKLIKGKQPPYRPLMPLIQ